MYRCTRILYTRGGIAGGLSSGELIDNPNTDTPLSVGLHGPLQGSPGLNDRFSGHYEVSTRGDFSEVDTEAYAIHKLREWRRRQESDAASE
jgi:hypothetical protein